MGLLYALEGIRTPFLNAVFSAITVMGGEWVFIAVAILVFWCFNKKNGYYLMAAGVIGTVMSQFMKIVFQIARPWVRDPHFTIVESARGAATGYSFPSGHTQNGAVVMGGVARFTKRKWLRGVCIALVVLIGFSRMYLGVHTPADVGVALVCGLALVFGLYPLFEKSGEKPQYITVVFAVATVLALFAALYVQFYPWSADVDATNLAEALKNSYTMLGCAAAALVGYPIERKHIRFETKAPWWAQLLKTALGLGLMAGLKAALKSPLLALFGGYDVAHTVRYFITVLSAIILWPLTFPWFEKGCPLGRKMKKALKAAGVFVLVLALLFGAAVFVVTRNYNPMPVESDNADNPYITSLGVSMLSGHRIGGDAPENTMMALKNCVESDSYSVDILEFDLHLTADGVLVLLHDETLDRTSDAAAYFGQTNVDASTKTFAELKNLNMGAQFIADDGTMPYAALTGETVPEELRIISLGEALSYLEANGHYRYIIEIKNSGELGYEAADKLYAFLNEYDCLDRAVVGTFHNEVTAYIDSTYPDMLRSAGVSECIKFYVCSLLNLSVSRDTFRYEALQIPTTDYVVNMGTSQVVNYAHRYNIAVQYWTINDAAEMARLESIGADAILTDDPQLGSQVLHQP